MLTAATSMLVLDLGTVAGAVAEHVQACPSKAVENQLRIRADLWGGTPRSQSLPK